MKKHLYLFLTLLALFCMTTGVIAQSTTSGDIAGTVTDPTGAVISGAKVTATNISTGATKTVTTSGSGGFRVALLLPGTYKVEVTAANFSSELGTVVVSAGAVSTDDVKLAVGSGSTTVEVSGQAEIVNTTNGDVTTTFSAEQVAALPNPGNDLTFVAQTAPGSVMNTGTAAGGYGNFSSFGVSGLSNMFTLDGGYENDPFLNLNNTGASNLTLGNNEVDTVTVVSPAFSSQYGGLGGAQVNEITAGGGNHVHGNASYYWDGSALNANDFFNKQSQAFYGEKNQPTRVNANQWAASIGGPLIHDKLFWFVNTEGIRATTPQNANINVPNAAAQACALGTAAPFTAGQLATTVQYGGEAINDIYVGAGLANPGLPQDVSESTTQQYLYGANYSDCGTLNLYSDQQAAIVYHNNDFGTNLPTANPALVGNVGEGGIPFFKASGVNAPLMSTIFGVYNNSPLRATTPIQSPIDPSANTYYAKNSATLTEWLLTARVDYKIGEKDNFFIHYKQDHGIQPTYTDLLDPRFTTQSKQPAWEGQINESHSFTPNLVNQLVLTGNYYSAPFENDQNYLGVAPFTFIPITGSYYQYGGINYDFPQGRNVSGYQVIDDVSYTKGRNTIRFGYNIRRNNITDIQGVEVATPAIEGSQEGFLSGTVDYEFLQHFPARTTQPISVYDMGFYVEDAYKVTPQLTVTAGIRTERNSNPICHTNCFSTFKTAIGSLPTSASATPAANLPYNAAFGGAILGNRYRAFTGYQKALIMPRVGVNYQVTPKTTFRAGFGMFSDSFPGIIADDALSNVPTQYKAIAYGYLSGKSGNAYDLNPASPGSGNVVAADSALRFRQGFTTGATYTTIKNQVLADTGSPYSAPSFIASAPHVNYPTYEEWSAAIEQRIDSKSTLAVTYVGNHGYHEPVSDASNNLASTHTSATYFANIPHAAPFTEFGTVTNIYSGASSNFNGVVVTGTRRSKNLTLQFNYEFSKALDEISNGGLEPFAPDAGDSAALVSPGNLHANYGLADYNVKHNVTGSFVYSLPTLFKGGSELVRTLVGGFEFSGDVFHQSGLPYSVTQSLTAGGAGIPYSISGGSALLLAAQTTNNFDHHCGGGQHVVLPNGILPTPCGFTSAFATPTNFNGGQSRNSLIGPSYTNVDFGAFKTFGIAIPHLEGTKLKLGAQFFNLFNHTNFQNPSHARGSNNADIGGISSTVGAPTSVLGSTGGADASPRLIQLHAALVF